MGAVAGAIGGAGILAGAAAGVGSVVKVAGKVGGAIGKGTKVVTSKVAASAAKLVTGQGKEERAIIAQVKDEAKEAQSKLNLAEKLQKLGKTKDEAYRLAGITSAELGPTGAVVDWNVSKILAGQTKGTSGPNAANGSQFGGRIGGSETELDYLQMQKAQFGNTGSTDIAAMVKKYWFVPAGLAALFLIPKIIKK